MTLSPRKRKILGFLSWLTRLYLGGIFIWASLYKIYEPQEFALSVATYQMLPLPFINLFTLALPWVELVVGIALVLGFWTFESATLISGMMLMFMTALGFALSKGLQMSCGCFASQDAADEIGVHTLVRDGAWLLMAWFIMLVDKGDWGLDRWIAKRRRYE